MNIKKSLIIFPFIIVAIFSIVLLERIITKYPLEILKLLFFSVFYSIHPLISLFLGERYLNKNPYLKEIFWKMPFYSIIPSIAVVFLWILIPIIFSNAGSEYGMIIFYIPLLILIFTISYALISLFLSTILYFQNKFYLITLMGLVLILFLISLVISINYISSCGIEGCRDINHLSKMAMNNKDVSICKLALPDDEGLFSPILVGSEFIGGTISECYLKLSQISNNQKLCEEVGLIFRDKCFLYFAENGFPMQCEEMKESNSKNICYFEYATFQKKMEYCDKIQAISKGENHADYLIEADAFTQKRCQQIIDPKLKKVEDWLEKITSKIEPSIEECYSDRLKDQGLVSHCISGTAFNNDDPRLCRYLSEELRQKCCNDVFARLFDRGREAEDHSWIADNLVLTIEQEGLCGLR